MTATPAWAMGLPGLLDLWLLTMSSWASLFSSLRCSPRLPSVSTNQCNDPFLLLVLRMQYKRKCKQTIFQFLLMLSLVLE